MRENLFVYIESGILLVMNQDATETLLVGFSFTSCCSVCLCSFFDGLSAYIW
jgi:hypothetical protein